MANCNLKIILLSLIFAGACSVDKNTPPIHDMNFSRLTPILIKVDKIEIINTSKYKKNNDITMRLPFHPILAVEKWVDRRLKPVGGVGSEILLLRVKDLSVIENKLEGGKSIKDFFTEQSHKYVFNIEVRMEILGAGSVKSFTNVNVIRHLTLSEGLSVNERDIRLHQGTKNLMDDFEREIFINLSKYFQLWLG